MADPIAHPAVRRVQAALTEAGSAAQVIALAETARSAEDAAASIGTSLGSIVKSLIFTVGGAPVMALVAGDRRCDAKALGRALGREGKVRRADAVRAAAGFSIGGVAPVAHETPLPVAIDASLGPAASRPSTPPPATPTASSPPHSTSLSASPVAPSARRSPRRNGTRQINRPAGSASRRASEAASCP